MSQDMVHAGRAVVVSMEQLSTIYYRLVIKAAVVAERAVPGQFVMVRPRPDATDPLLGRPLAVFETDRGNETFSVLFTVAGKGTKILSETTPGKEVFVNGPLGRGFAYDKNTDIIAVGGGTGLAPLYFLARKARETGKRAHLILGARTDGILPPEKTLGPKGDVHCATDDGSYGFKGTAVDAFRDCIKRHAFTIGASTGVFTAGPMPMMKALAVEAQKMNIPLQASLEARMGCGIGVCRGCVIPALTPHPLYGMKQRAVCYDGPVFNAAEIDWNAI